MGKRHQSMQAICPFYKAEETRRIVCEGPCARATIHVIFEEPERKRQYAKRFCRSWQYEHCLIAQMQEKRYEE